MANPTIKDVALAAGVSVGSVSRVINGAPGLRPETERAVMAAIVKLGYHPSKVARSLRMRAVTNAQTARHAGRPMLVCIGSLSLDNVVLLDALPTPGERLQTRGVHLFIGGPGAIVAVSARRLGAPFEINVEFSAVVGDDRESDEAIERLTSLGIGTGAMVRDPAGHLQRSVVLVEPSGRRTILGSRAIQVPPGLRFRLDRLAGHGTANVVHIEGYLLDSCLPTARELAALGWTLSMDTTGLPATHGSAAALAGLSHVFRLIFLSCSMARRIAPGLPDADLPGAVAAELSREGWSRDCRIVVHLGPDGSALLDAGGRIQHAVGVPVTPVDVTGAGDVFVGVFLAATMSGAPDGLALRHATVAADLSTQALGVNEADLGAGRIEAAIAEAEGAVPLHPSMPGVTISG